jgi:hypothetical protein
MPELNQTYNFNSLYICLIIILYNIFISNYEYIKLFIGKITLYNYTSLILIINIIGIYLFLKNVIFEVKFKISYKLQTLS